MIGITIDSMHVGDSAEITRVATEQDIAGFVDAVGDHNPIHSDRHYAAGTAFREPIAPGIWTAGLISAVIGTRLPGPGTIYLSQDLKFLKPVLFGDMITTRVEVIECNREKNRARLRTACTNQRGESVLIGEALVMPSRTEVAYEEQRSGRGLVALWAFQPWALAAQAVALWSMLGLSAWSLAVPRPSTPRLSPLARPGGATT
jgi:3-hydroxybutyryl-CoA dehydratase